MEDDKIAKLLLTGFTCNTCRNTSIDYDNGDVKCTVKDMWMDHYELYENICKDHTSFNKK